MKKYRLTDERIPFEMPFGNIILVRIEALKSFGNVKKGQRGGWVSGDWNLSQEGNCWIDDEAKVYNFARIYGNAQIKGFAEVSDYAVVTDNAEIFGQAKITRSARVEGSPKIGGCARIRGNAFIYGDKIFIGGNVEIGSNIVLNDNVNLNGYARIMNDNDIKIFNWNQEYPLAITTNPETLYHCGSFTGTQSEFLQFIGLKNIKKI